MSIISNISRRLFKPAMPVSGVERRGFIRALAAAVILPHVLIRCDESAEPTPSMILEGDSLFRIQLLEGGLDLGTFPVKITTYEASEKTVIKTLEIPLLIENDNIQDLYDLKLSLQLSIDAENVVPPVGFTFPTNIVSWKIPITEELSIGSEKPIPFNPADNKAIIGLSSKINWEETALPAKILIALLFNTSEAFAGKHYTIPIQAVLQGTKED